MPTLFEHGAQQRGLVLAVAVAVAEDVIRRVGLQAADADLDADIADVALHVIGDGSGPSREVGLAGDEHFGLGAEVRCGLGAGRGQCGVPVADGGPARIAGGLWVARVADDEAAGHGPKLRRHGDVFEVNAGNAVDLPAIMTGRGLAGSHASVLAGGDGVVPVRRQDQLEDGVKGGDAVLKVPGVLLHIGPHGALVLVCDDSAGIGGGGAGYLGMEIDIKHPVLVIANFGHLVVAQGVGMAVGGDAPDVE